MVREGAVGEVEERSEGEVQQQEPRGNALNRMVDRLANKLQPVKHGDPKNPPGPNRVTHERPFVESKGFAFGLEFGVTVSELHQIRRKDGAELVHVVNPDGSSNLELVLGRKELGLGQRVELQGPALNTSLTPGQLPVGARFFGVGLTSDLVDPKSHEAVSYTLEVKATERSAAELALLAAPGAAAAATQALGSEAAGIVAQVFSIGVPIVGAALAVSSAYHAFKVLKSPKQSKLNKTLAVAHAVSDAVRVFFPLAGVLGNAALVGISAAITYVKLRKLKGQRAEAKTGPPAGELAKPTPSQQPPRVAPLANGQRSGQRSAQSSAQPKDSGDSPESRPEALPAPIFSQ
ncbi:MAG: hypothetical protein HY791_39725 [Deltaproteobacteria bacterium]|nr:hypothetical protein [Deltaproteobacteria bacterium]